MSSIRQPRTHLKQCGVRFDRYANIQFPGTRLNTGKDISVPNHIYARGLFEIQSTASAAAYETLTSMLDIHASSDPLNHPGPMRFHNETHTHIIHHLLGPVEKDGWGNADPNLSVFSDTFTRENNRYYSGKFQRISNTEIITNRYLYLFRVHAVDNVQHRDAWVTIEKEIFIDDDSTYHVLEQPTEHGDSRSFASIPGDEYVMLAESEPGADGQEVRARYYLWLSDIQLTVNRLEYLRRVIQHSYRNRRECNIPFVELANITPPQTDSEMWEKKLSVSNTPGHAELGRTEAPSEKAYWSVILHDYARYTEQVLATREDAEVRIQQLTEDIPASFEGNAECDNVQTVLGLIYRSILESDPLDDTGRIDAGKIRNVLRRVDNSGYWNPFTRQETVRQHVEANIRRILGQIYLLRLNSQAAAALLKSDGFNEYVLDAFFCGQAQERARKAELVDLLLCAEMSTAGYRTVAELQAAAHDAIHAQDEKNRIRALQDDRTIVQNYRLTVDRALESGSNTLPRQIIPWMCDLELPNTAPMNEENAALILTLAGCILNASQRGGDEPPQLLLSTSTLELKVTDAVSKSLTKLADSGILAGESTTVRLNDAYSHVMAVLSYLEALQKLHAEPSFTTFLEFSSAQLTLIEKAHGVMSKAKLDSTVPVLTAYNKAATPAMKKAILIKGFLTTAPAAVDSLVSFIKAGTYGNRGGRDATIAAALHGAQGVITLGILVIAPLFIKVALPVALITIVVNTILGIWASSMVHNHLQHWIRTSVFGTGSPLPLVSDGEETGITKFQWRPSGERNHYIIGVENEREWSPAAQAQAHELLPWFYTMETTVLNRPFDALTGAIIVHMKFPRLAPGAQVYLDVGTRPDVADSSLLPSPIKLRNNENCRVLYHNGEFHVFCFIHVDHHTQRGIVGSGEWKKFIKRTAWISTSPIYRECRHATAWKEAIRTWSPSYLRNMIRLAYRMNWVQGQGIRIQTPGNSSVLLDALSGYTLPEKLEAAGSTRLYLSAFLRFESDQKTAVHVGTIVRNHTDIQLRPDSTYHDLQRNVLTPHFQSSLGLNPIANTINGRIKRYEECMRELQGYPWNQ